MNRSQIENQRIALQITARRETWSHCHIIVRRTQALHFLLEEILTSHLLQKIQIWYLLFQDAAYHNLLPFALFGFFLSKFLDIMAYHRYSFAPCSNHISCFSVHYLSIPKPFQSYSYPVSATDRTKDKTLANLPPVLLFSQG